MKKTFNPHSLRVLKGEDEVYTSFIEITKDTAVYLETADFDGDYIAIESGDDFFSVYHNCTVEEMAMTINLEVVSAKSNDCEFEGRILSTGDEETTIDGIPESEFTFSESELIEFLTKMGVAKVTSKKDSPMEQVFKSMGEAYTKKLN